MSNRSLKSIVSWLCDHRVLAFATLFGCAFTVFAYFFPFEGLSFSEEKVHSEELPTKVISIPVILSNQLRAEVYVNPIVDFAIYKPGNEGSENVIETGAVRLKRPERITSINGMYPISVQDEVKTEITLPKSSVINEALREGGYMFRLSVDDTWVFDQHEDQDVLFDDQTLADGIRVVFYQE